MNKVILIGRLTKDPEVRYGQGGSQTTVARFSIAVDRRYKRDGEPTADFFNCTAFGKQAEFVDHYLHKGIKMVVVGRIQNDNYTNKDGQMVYSVRIMVDELEFAESKNSSSENSGNYSSGSYGSGSYGSENGYRNSSSSDKPVDDSFDDDFMNIPEGMDDMTFPFSQP